MAFLVGFVQLLAIVAPAVLFAGLLLVRARRRLGAVVLGAAIAASPSLLLDMWLATRTPAAAIAHQRVDSWFTGAAFLQRVPGRRGGRRHDHHDVVTT